MYNLGTARKKLWWNMDRIGHVGQLELRQLSKSEMEQGVSRGIYKHPLGEGRKTSEY